MMGLDELFEVLDCYVEESITSSDWINCKKTPYWEPKTWYSTPTGVNENINETTAKISPAIYTVPGDGKISTITNIDSLQLTTGH